MSTLEQAKKHLQDVINQQVDATVCPLDDAKIHAAIVDYILAALLEGDDGVANEKCGDELIKLFEGKLGEAALTSFVARVDSVYDTVRTICYLSDKGDGPFGWNVLNNQNNKFLEYEEFIYIENSIFDNSIYVVWVFVDSGS